MTTPTTRSERRRAKKSTSSQTTLRRILSPIVVGVLIIALFAVGMHFLRSNDGSSPASLKEPCTGTAKVSLVVAPDIAELITDVTKSNTGLLCGTFTITPQESYRVLSDIAGQRFTADGWIADSSLWVKQAQEQADVVKLTADDPFAVSPVVIAAPDKQRSAVLPEESISWKRFLNGAVKGAKVPDPAYSTTGMVGLVAARMGIAGSDDQVRLMLGQGLLTMAEGMVKQASALPAGSSKATPAGAYMVTEQQVAAYNKQHPQDPFSVAVPTEGTLPIEYQVVRAAGERSVATAIERLSQKLREQDVATKLREEGLRLSTNDSGPTLNRGMSYSLTMSDVPEAKLANKVLRQWKSMTAPMRILTVVDTSGSMKQVSGNKSRMDFTVDALTAGTSQLKPLDQVGLWEFSNNNERKGNWRVVSPVMALGDATPGTVRSVLPAKMQGLKGLLGGDTPLYDTIADAVAEMQKTYNSDMTNVVLVLTDGKNDNPQGLTLEALTQKLQSATVSGKPVHVLTLGVGDGTDPAALKQIADATSGESGVATNPQDITKLIIESLMKV